MHVDRIKELEDDALEGQERTDDLSAQLGEAQEQLVRGTMKVKTRAESILNIYGDQLGDLSDEASNVGDEQELNLPRQEVSQSRGGLSLDYQVTILGDFDPCTQKGQGRW